VHINSNVFRDYFLGERNEALGNPAKHEPWIGMHVDTSEIKNEFRRRRDPRAHRRPEQLLLRVDMTEHGGRRDVELAGDVGESGRFESLRGKYAPRRIQELVS